MRIVTKSLLLILLLMSSICQVSGQESFFEINIEEVSIDQPFVTSMHINATEPYVNVRFTGRWLWWINITITTESNNFRTTYYRYQNNTGIDLAGEWMNFTLFRHGRDFNISINAWVAYNLTIIIEPFYPLEIRYIDRWYLTYTPILIVGLMVSLGTSILIVGHYIFRIRPKREEPQTTVE